MYISSCCLVFKKGLVFKGLVFNGLVFKGLVFKGLVFKGLVFKGLVFKKTCCLVFKKKVLLFFVCSFFPTWLNDIYIYKRIYMSACEYIYVYIYQVAA